MQQYRTHPDVHERRQLAHAIQNKTLSTSSKGRKKSRLNSTPDKALWQTQVWEHAEVDVDSFLALGRISHLWCSEETFSQSNQETQVTPLGHSCPHQGLPGDKNNHLHPLALRQPDNKEQCTPPPPTLQVQEEREEHLSHPLSPYPDCLHPNQRATWVCKPLNCVINMKVLFILLKA